MNIIGVYCLEVQPGTDRLSFIARHTSHATVCRSGVRTVQDRLLCYTHALRNANLYMNAYRAPASRMIRFLALWHNRKHAFRDDYNPCLRYAVLINRASISMISKLTTIICRKFLWFPVHPLLFPISGFFLKEVFSFHFLAVVEGSSASLPGKNFSFLPPGEFSCFFSLSCRFLRIFFQQHSRV